jgi:hypothetical protein
MNILNDFFEFSIIFLKTEKTISILRVRGEKKRASADGFA